MKQTKTFRLEADTIDYLKQKPNASAYLEELVEKDRDRPLDDRYSNKAIMMELQKIKSRLLDIENSGGRGTASADAPIVPVPFEQAATISPVEAQLAAHDLKYDKYRPNQAWSERDQQYVSYVVSNGVVELC